MKLSITLGTLCASLASAALHFVGVAESGGEFGAWSDTKTLGTGLPGTFGREWAFIGESGVDTYVDKHKVEYLMPHIVYRGLTITIRSTFFA